MSYKTFLFTALVCVLSWCCVSCESNDPTKNGGGSATYVAKEFSVSANKQVVFSPGNLQYQASTDTWRFAENQYDFLGAINDKISTANENWIDLFGWGTGNNPTEVYAYMKTFVDWGRNVIGISSVNTWRTLTISEWEYILERRAGAEKKVGVGTVNGIHGLILLPDQWSLPVGCTFVPGYESDLEWETNKYSTQKWQNMEMNGAVFLPAAGVRDDDDSYHFEYHPLDEGYYWSSSYDSEYKAGYCIYFDYGIADWDGFDVNWGASVRLVQDL